MRTLLISILLLTLMFPLGKWDTGFSMGRALASDSKGQGFNQGKGNKKPLKKLHVRFIEDLEFGEVSADSRLNGKVIIDPATGAKHVYGTLDLGGRYSRGELDIWGEPGERFMVTLPDQVQLSSKGGATLMLSDFTVFPDRTGVLGPDGKATIYLGATLAVKANNPSVKAKGTINIFVDYVP